tara:strand:- start:1419 stop:1664 length:246 start_codon:yes stop_codon:yes gene_type:complete
MKKILLVLFIAGCFTFQMYAESLADEKKTITPKEFATTISEVPKKVGNFLTNEVEKTKEYQKKSWAEMKTKWPFTMFKGKE